MKSRKLLTFIVAFAMAFTVFGCGFAVTADAAVKKPTKITLTATATTVDIGGKITVKVKSVSPSNAGKAVKWKSSNTKIATVSSKGVVTGKKTGTVKITATSKYTSKVSKSITIKVKDLKPKVYLDSSYVVYTRDDALKIKAKISSNTKYTGGVIYKLSSSSYAKLSTTKSTTGYVYITPKSIPSSSTYKKVTLTAYLSKDTKIKDTATLYVRNSVSKIAFDTSKLTNGELELKAGSSATVAAKVTSPSKPYSSALVYSSSNTKVATVSSSGKVTAKGAGVATIKATAKYGNDNKATASYKVYVYAGLTPTINGDKAEYAVDMSKYDYYEIAAEKDGENLDLYLTNGDLKNLTGNGDAGFDWMNADAKSFEDAQFNYTMTAGAAKDERYAFTKEDNEIYIRVQGTDVSVSSIWYYMSDSFKAGDNGDYTITLYSSNRGEQLDIVKSGNTVKMEKGNRAFSITKDAEDEYSIYLKKAAGSERTVTVKAGSDDVYTIILDKDDVDKYKAAVRAYVD